MESGYFTCQIKACYLMGTYLITSDNTKISRLKSLIHLVVFPYCQIVLAYSACKAIPSVGDICGFMGLFFGFLISAVKLYPYHFTHRNYAQILCEIAELDKKLTKEERDLVKRTSDMVQTMSTTNITILNMGSTLSLVLPFVWAVLQQVLGFENINWPIPFNCVYPFDINNPIIYTLIYISTTYLTFFICISGNVVDSLFLESTLILSVHYQILQNRLSKIDFSKPNYKRELIDLFEYHKEILKSIDCIHKAYSVSLMLFLVVASALICVMTFTVSMVYQRTYDLIIFLGYATSCFCQLFFYAYGGQCMEDESEKIITGIYSSNWTEATPKQRKFILPFMIRAQKQSLIKVFFYNIDLTVFIKIVAAAFSYMTLLQSLL